MSTKPDNKPHTKPDNKPHTEPCSKSGTKSGSKPGSYQMDVSRHACHNVCSMHTLSPKRLLNVCGMHTLNVCSMHTLSLTLAPCAKRTSTPYSNRLV